MVDIQSAAAEIRRGKKKEEEEERKKPQGKNIMACLLHRAAIISWGSAYLCQGTSYQYRDTDLDP